MGVQVVALLSNLSRPAPNLPEVALPLDLAGSMPPSSTILPAAHGFEKEEGEVGGKQNVVVGGQPREGMGCRTGC